MRGPNGETDALPETPLDLFSLAGLEGLAASAALAVARRAPVWRHPRRASGDFETMTFLDKVYWLYKCDRPMRRARRGSGLEAYFAKQRLGTVGLPEGFTAAGELTISAAGDIIPHPWLDRSQDTLYARVADRLFDADVPMANLECPVVDRGEDLQFAVDAAPTLYLSPRHLEIVTGHGDRRFGVFATANNHSLDHGADGIDSTRRMLDEAGVAHHGTNTSAAEAEHPLLLDRRGIRLAVLSWTFGLNGRRPPPDRPWIVNRCDLASPPGRADLSGLEQQLQHARGQADFVIAQLHWGLEHELYPTPEQVELAHHLAELGVDALIGHHPHVIQPVELYRTRRDPARVVPVYYSLGNLVNGFSAPHLTRGAIAHLELRKGQTAEGETRTYVSRASRSEVVQEADPRTRTARLRWAERGTRLARWEAVHSGSSSERRTP